MVMVMVMVSMVFILYCLTHNVLRWMWTDPSDNKLQMLLYERLKNRLVWISQCISSTWSRAALLVFTCYKLWRTNNRSSFLLKWWNSKLNVLFILPIDNMFAYVAATGWNIACQHFSSLHRTIKIDFHEIYICVWMWMIWHMFVWRGIKYAIKYSLNGSYDFGSFFQMELYICNKSGRAREIVTGNSKWFNQCSKGY